MRWRYFIILQVVLLLIVGGLLYKHQNKVALVKVPPADLSQWYKPENKRQVWLHNMFKLRREMQAVELYAEQKDSENLVKWSAQLTKHYLKIADMVPSWQKKLDIKTMYSLNEASEANDFNQVSILANKLTKNCDSCHDDYQAVTALTYRSGNFSSIKVNGDIPYSQHMDILTKQVNKIKISAQDGFTDRALSSLSELNISMNELGESCGNCHKQDKRTYPNEQMTNTLQNLKIALQSGTAKEQGRELGTLAVLACARCHGTHRTAYEVKKQLNSETSLMELLKH